MQGLILSCGEGSRLYPFTKFNSKALVPYMGRTALYYQCQKMKKLGIDKVTLFYNKGKVEDFKRAIEDIDINLSCEYVESGWGNTWNKAKELFKADIVVILNCDIMLDSSYNDVAFIHTQNRADLSIVCSNNKSHILGREGRKAYIKKSDGWVKEYSTIPYDNSIEVKQIGMSIVNPDLWRLIAELDYYKFDPWTESFIPLAVNEFDRVQVIEKEGNFQDIGTWEAMYASYYNPLDEFEECIEKKASNICESNVVMNEKSLVKNTVVMRDSKIDFFAEVCNAIVLPGIHVEKNVVNDYVIKM